MKRNRGIDSSSHVENNINPTVSRLVNEVNTLLTIHELQSKLTRLPSDLPSVKKVKEEIRNFLILGELSSKLDQEKADLIESERKKMSNDINLQWNKMLLEIELIVEESKTKKNLIPSHVILNFLRTARKDTQYERPAILSKSSI
jgi:hypothetical protein